MMTSFIRMSQKLVLHQSKCICAIKRILFTTAMYVSSSSFMCLRIPCYCDACLNSSALRVGVKTLLNTIPPTFNKVQFTALQNISEMYCKWKAHPTQVEEYTFRRWNDVPLCQNQF